MISKRQHLSKLHVWSLDPALDKSKGFEKRWKKFLETSDLGDLPVLDGRRVTVFHIVSLKREDNIALWDLLGDRTTLRAMEFAVAHGLQRIENWVDEAGRQINVKHDDDGRVSKETLDDLHYPELILELGARIAEISKPGPTLGQGS